MSLEHVLLGMLREPAAGYDLKREFAEDGTRLFWFAELSQIYPALQRMEEKRWLTSRRQASSKGPARRVYRRTKAGERALFEWCRAGPDMGTDRFPYIGQLISLGQLKDPEATRSFLVMLRANFAERYALLLEAEAYYADRVDDSDIDLHELMAVRLGVRSLRGRIEACDEAIELLESKKGLGHG